MNIFLAGAVSVADKAQFEHKDKTKLEKPYDDRF